MAQATNKVLADAQATPVNHTFIPLGVDKNGVLWLEDQSGNSPIGYNRISISLVRAPVPTNGSNAGERTARAHIKVFTPKLETMGTNDSGIVPPDRVAYVQTDEYKKVVSERSTEVERKTGTKYMSSLLTDAQILDLVGKLIPLS